MIHYIVYIHLVQMM